MERCQQLHETIVRDIIDVMNDVKNFDQVEWLKNKNGVGSIAKRASNLTLVFPVICSNSLNIQTAYIISKAIERKCVSLLQILFSSVQITSAENMNDYIRQFHSNLNIRNGITLDDFITTMDSLVDEGAITVTDVDIYNAVKEDMRNINYHLSEEFNPVSINDYRLRKNPYDESYIVEAKRRKNSRRNNRSNNNSSDNTSDNSNNRSSSRTINTDELFSSNQFRNAVDGRLRSTLNHRTKNALNNAQDPSNEINYFRYQLSTGEVDKANELMPTTMIVNFTTKDDKGGYFTTTGVVGVKAKLYPVDAMDICNRISSKYKDSNTLFNLVRASTREISFFKDLAFAIDKAKIDAVNLSRESNNARMFKVLERRAARNRFSTLLKKNDASPITSLIMSQDEVEYLKKYNSIDMEKSHVTRSILEKYNLMDIVIADEALEVARFLFDDGDGIYETLPFDALEKEAKDSSYKKIVNLMSRVNR